jgi:hypothetical protein
MPTSNSEFFLFILRGAKKSENNVTASFVVALRRMYKNAFMPYMQILFR